MKKTFAILAILFILAAPVMTWAQEPGCSCSVTCGGGFWGGGDTCTANGICPCTCTCNGTSPQCSCGSSGGGKVVPVQQ